MRRPVATGTGTRLVVYTYHKDNPNPMTVDGNRYGQDLPLLINAPQLVMDASGTIHFPDGNTYINNYEAMDTLHGYTVARVYP